MSQCYEVCYNPKADSPSQPLWNSKYCGVPEATIQTICNLVDGFCPQAQDCQLSDWSDWSSCSLPNCDASHPDGGVQTRDRTILAPAYGDGKPCSEFELVDTQVCNSKAQCNPIDCQMGAWQTLSNLNCSAPCGTGTILVYRTITTFPSGGGAACPLSQWEYATYTTCNTQSCNACEYESWDTYFAREGPESWGTCSGINGTQQAGPRQVIQQPTGGQVCDPSQAFQERSCCVDGNCSYCGMGCDNQVCSGHGTCVTNTTNGVTTGYCDCDAGFYGSSCGVQCPVGPNGLVCSGAGSCSSLTGACLCQDGFEGSFCSKMTSPGVCYLAVTDPYVMNGLTSQDCVTSDGTLFGVVAFDLDGTSLTAADCMAMDGKKIYSSNGYVPNGLDWYFDQYLVSGTIQTSVSTQSMPSSYQKVSCGLNSALANLTQALALPVAGNKPFTPIDFGTQFGKFGTSTQLYVSSNQTTSLLQSYLLLKTNPSASITDASSVDKCFFDTFGPLACTAPNKACCCASGGCMNEYKTPCQLS